MGLAARSGTEASRSHPFDEDMAIQRVQWKFERVAWAILGLFVLLSLMGLFAEGPVGRTTATDRSGRMLVEYPRFLRHGAATRMEVRVTPAGSENFAITLDRDFIRAFTVDAEQPAGGIAHRPRSSRVGIRRRRGRSTSRSPRKGWGAA